MIGNPEPLGVGTPKQNLKFAVDQFHTQCLRFWIPARAGGKSLSKSLDLIWQSTCVPKWREQKAKDRVDVAKAARSHKAVLEIILQDAHD